jgi:hypothetical protein
MGKGSETHRGVRFDSALAVRRLEMQLSEIQLIAVVAAKACAAAVNHPRNKDLREDLFDLLGPVAKLAQVDGTTYSAHLHDLLRQTGVWADIVRQAYGRTLCAAVLRIHEAALWPALSPLSGIPPATFNICFANLLANSSSRLMCEDRRRAGVSQRASRSQI